MKKSLTCPIALVSPKSKVFCRTTGCRCIKLMNDKPSPVTRRAAQQTDKIDIHLLVFAVITVTYETSTSTTTSVNAPHNVEILDIHLLSTGHEEKVDLKVDHMKEK